MASSIVLILIIKFCYLPDFVMIISVPRSWNLLHKSCVSSVQQRDDNPGWVGSSDGGNSSGDPTLSSVPDTDFVISLSSFAATIGVRCESSHFPFVIFSSTE